MNDANGSAISRREFLKEIESLAVEGDEEVPGPVARLFDSAEHHGDVAAQPHCVRGLVRGEPLLGIHLVRAQNLPHVVVEDLRSSAG